MTNYLNFFNNKVVVISGGSGGLGQAISQELLSTSAKIASIDIEQKATSNNPNLLLLECNITDPEAVNNAINTVVTQFGKIDILINNAGITHMSRIEDTSIELINQIMQVNFMGSVLLTQACLEQIKHNKGSLVAISSVAGFAPLYGRSAYSASKHAMEGFFSSLACELEEFGVQTNIIRPSFIQTRPELTAKVNQGVSSPGANKKNSAGNSLSSDVASRAILKSIANKKPYLLLGKIARIAYALNKFLPKTYRKVMTKGAKEEFL